VTLATSILFNSRQLICTTDFTRPHSIIMSGPGVGFEYPPVEVAWLKRDVLLFANTIGATTDELHFLYVWAFLSDPPGWLC
jgi:hypothetical protein